jgi:hypothetical protein
MGSPRTGVIAAGFVAAGLVVAAFAREAAACGWDDEVYYAEAKTLPCLAGAITDSYPRHTPEYWRARAEAADLALAVDPHATWALDLGAIARMRLGKLSEAEGLMRHRAEVEPDAYATHANLGTLHTFDGRYDLALEHIDRALVLEPRAHFGREKYHRLLVVYLRRLAAEPGKGHERESFLGVPVSDDDRLHGSPAAFDARMQQHWLGRDVFDALDAMITVYGAGANPHVYAAAGDMLALFGAHALAALAYQAAIARKHPAAKDLRRLVDAEFALVQKATETQPNAVRAKEEDERAGQPREPREFLWAMARARPMGLRPAGFEKYQAFERKEVARGLRVWTADGVGALYAKQEELKLRCPVGLTFPELAAPAPPQAQAPAAGTAAARPPTPALAAAVAALGALETAAHHLATTFDCSATSASLASLRAAPPIGSIALSRSVDGDELLRARRITALQDIISAQRRCDRERARRAR